MPATSLILCVVLGVIARAILPYLVARKDAIEKGEEGLGWGAKFWLPPLFAAIIAIPSAILALNVLPPEIQTWYGAIAFGLTWAGQDLLRLGQKFLSG
jgi:phosphotransferase system  glucose/maltose/N-acetylglucosamine-specific IIC component